LSENRKAH
jgi:hypothetical protein